MASNPPSPPAPSAGAPARTTELDRLAGLSEGAIRLLREANAALAQRNASALQSRMAALSALAPTHPEVLRLRAAIAHTQGNRAEAMELMRRVLAARPNDAQTAFDLGNALAHAGDIDGAVASFRRSAEIEPRRIASSLAIAQLLEQRGDVDQAIVLLQDALDREPDNVPARNRLARALHFAGRIDDARAEYRRTLQRFPNTAMAWYGLSTLRTLLFDADDLAALESLAGRVDVREQERAPLLFALAKAREDNGSYDAAFAALTAANAARRRGLAWDAAKFSANARAIEHAFAAHTDAHDGDARNATPHDATVAGDGIIFIVGMPRSGSTLIEQILAAHPEVVDGGELDHVRDIIRDESQRRASDFPAWISQATPEDWRRLGQIYLDRVAARRGTQRWFTDKALLNWRYLGALRSMLPGARFVDCRRDAVETCLSCYRQLFATELAFTYDLAELAAFWRDYDRLMAFWRARFPTRILAIELERLTADPDREIRRLLDFCGLPFDAATLRFHENTGSVRTASATQVREPMRRVVARADTFGVTLDPLRKMLRG